jgi:hypothetical protein
MIHFIGLALSWLSKKLAGGAMVKNSFLRCAMMTALVCALGTAFAVSEASAQATAVGDASFNAADRLAVINLVSSYGYFYDRFDMAGFQSLFTDSPVFEFWVGDTKVVSGISEVLRDSVEWRKDVKTEQGHRRHFLAPTRFDRQTESEATGEVYLAFYELKNGAMSLVTTGEYDFIAVKANGEWKLSKWVGRVDSSLK